MDLLFLDANILFSAAYQENASLKLFWTLDNVQRITSHYAVEEARRNLKSPEQKHRLDLLLKAMKVLQHEKYIPLPTSIKLKDKDRPILAASIAMGAHILITGDFQDFGHFFGKKVAGVMVLPPAEYLNRYQLKLR